MKPIAWCYCDSFKPVIWHLTKDAKVAAAYKRKGWIVRPLVDVEPATTSRYTKKNGKLLASVYLDKLMKELP